MLVKGPAPDSGVASVPIAAPDAPADGQFETRELPLVAPAGGATGLQTGQAKPLQDAATPATPPTVDTSPAVAAGNYAVTFGAYGSRADADAVIAYLQRSQLPGFAEATTINGRQAWRVRVGPYADRAQAEAARLQAVKIRADVKAEVITRMPQRTAAPRWQPPRHRLRRAPVPHPPPPRRRPAATRCAVKACRRVRRLQRPLRRPSPSRRSRRRSPKPRSPSRSRRPPRASRQRPRPRRQHRPPAASALPCSWARSARPTMPTPCATRSAPPASVLLSSRCAPKGHPASRPRRAGGQPWRCRAAEGAGRRQGRRRRHGPAAPMTHAQPRCQRRRRSGAP